MKPIRHAVRVFLIKDNKVIVIKYKSNDVYQNGYLDIPGGKLKIMKMQKKQQLENLRKKRGY